jgi:pyroglutamyl-peptidase
MKIVVTGFGPFHTNDVNPSREILGLLPKSIYGNEIIKLEVPVVYDACFDPLKQVIELEKPDVVICLGLAQGRRFITPERVAVNLKDASIADNNGTIFTGETIMADGENAYFSTLPIKKMVSNMLEKDLPSMISNAAGLYICNNIMYHLLYYVNQNKLDIQAGFIHLPMMDEGNETEMFSLPLERLLEGVIDSIKACLKDKEEYL